MKGIIACVFLICFPVAERHPSSFFSEYAVGCASAYAYFMDSEAEWDEIKDVQSCDKAFLFSIVFPEIAVYNSSRDKMETGGLELFYVNLGEDYANFSIGLFQMKPSFIRSMEQRVLCDTSLHSFDFITKFSLETEKGIRAERVIRLKNRKWQINYLRCFYKIMEQRFKDKQFKDDIEKLSFYATAYNRGFDNTEGELMKWSSISYFPYGKYGLGRTNYCYGKIACEIYSNLKQ
jgi:hypothetical protein